MAVGAFAVEGGNTSGFAGRITVSVVITCIVAATSGLIFGYDIGISGAFCCLDSYCIVVFVHGGLKMSRSISVLLS